MHNPRSIQSNPTALRTMVMFAVSAGLALLMTGCSSSMPSNFGVSTPGGGAHVLMGQVLGGQQPVTGSVIQLYTVGTTGLKSASTALISATVTTDSNGAFSITGDYSCTGSTPGTQVYITATGGSATTGGANNNLTMAAALGSCSNLLANAANTFINIDEVTTVAAAYALAPFASSMTSIGASGSNPTGLVNAFANAAMLANTSTGTSGGAGLAAGVTVPTTELNTLADIVAACVNTTGAGSAACNTLFTATGASDTFGAALAIANNPGASAITALTSVIPATAPFQPNFASAPKDFTVAVTMAGSSTLSTPYAVAIDGSGNAWVANESGSNVAEFSPVGAVLATPTATGLYGAQGIAIDKTSSNIWVANTAGNSVIQFPLVSGVPATPNIYTGNGIDAPSAIAIDLSGDAFIANFNGNSVTELSNAGSNLNGSPFTGNSNNIVSPSGIAIGITGTVYVTSANGYVVKLNGSGVYSGMLNDSVLQAPTAVAAGSSAEVVATGFTTGTAVGGALSEFAGPSASANSPVATSFTDPSGIATDFVSFWVANGAASGGLAQYSYNSTTSVSPATGYGSLNAPVGVAVDASGSVWTANSGSNTLSVFIGVAAPVTTPLAATISPI